MAPEIILSIGMVLGLGIAAIGFILALFLLGVDNERS